MTKTKKILSKNKGFTLVELIVVLVILAILAAILVPTLLGYIDKARSEKDFATAQAVRVATQAQIDELYGKGDDKVEKSDINKNDVKKEIFKLVGAVSDNKIDGQELDIKDIKITNNQIDSIIVQIGSKYYKYTSSSNTWEATSSTTL
ncbi:prepilin-type N-terminal cleavage/methylation domain-containing protein [Lachnospiraceae bacterium XPB1003]|nr:prepilin-type N-terminal cleavage/methylation domain-containing protein [Lachnospiraceae bacterium XPB1003]